LALIDNVLIECGGDEVKVELQPHLGLIGLIASLRAGGHEGVLYDPKLAIERKEVALEAGFYAAIARRIRNLDADAVGFTTLGCNFACTIRIAQELKLLRPDLPIVLGGPHATILDREILDRYHVFDAIVRGEADETIVPFADALSGARPLGDVPGITYRDNGTVVRTPDAPQTRDLDALPFPAYDAYPIHELGLTMLRVDAGRGCPFHCTFCSTATFFGRRYRLKSAVRLVEELDRLSATYGVRSFTLNHDLFTVNAKKIREFCEAVAGRGYTWSCSARMDCVDDGLLAEMARAGCDAIFYGVETGSRRLQTVVEKNLDLDLYHPRVRTSLALGMQTTASLITGYPDETVEDQDQTLALIEESINRYGRELDVQLHMLTPEPGTALHARFAGTLAYDGHVTDFIFPPIEPADRDLAAADPGNFVCHYYYAAGIDREENLVAVDGYRGLYSLDRCLLRALAAAFGSLAELVRGYGRFRLRSGLRLAESLAIFVDGRLGGDHPLAEAVRYVTAVSALRPELRRPVLAPAPADTIVLASCVRPLGKTRDGAELLRRLQTGDVAFDLERRHRLLIGTRDAGSHAAFTVDEPTLEAVRRLEDPSTAQQLCSGRDGGAIRTRLETLCLLGAVVQAAPEPASALGGTEAKGDRHVEPVGLQRGGCV
jgi:hypothetical protein